MSTVTTTQSWGSRVGSSFKGILGGFLFVVVGVVALFWNEGRTIKRTRALNEGAKVCVEATPDKVDPANEGKLIHLSGSVETDETLTDAEFGIDVPALRLVRKTEMYQWQEDQHSETKRTSGGGTETTTTYTYKKVWSEQVINSGSFHDAGYDNPLQKKYESEDFRAKNAKLGAFRISDDQVADLGPKADYDPNTQTTSPAEDAEGTPEGDAPASEPAAEQPAEASAEGAGLFPSLVGVAYAQDISIAAPELTDQNVVISAGGNDVAEAAAPATEGNAEANDGKDYVPFQKGCYVGNPDDPQIGDLKITWQIVTSPCPTSFVMKQEGDALGTYQTENGPLALQQPGLVSAEEMFTEAHKANKLTAWIIRLIGFIVIFIGIKSVFAPLEVIADKVPFAARIVGVGTGFVAFGLAACLSLVSIAVGWFWYRPILSIVLLVIAVAAAIIPFVLKKQRAKNAESPV